MRSKRIKMYNKWTEYESNCLKQLVEMQEGKIKWKKISFQMSEMYQISKRSGKQCRERWTSYLNSHNNNQPWSLEEDRNLFQQQKKFGTKWSQIAKCFSGRTDSSIKNRFYSKIRKALRKMCKYLNFTKGTATIQRIKPNTLIQIFKKGQTEYPQDPQNESTLKQCKQIIKRIFYFMEMNVNQNQIELSKKQVAWTINKILQIHDIQEDLLTTYPYQEIDDEQDSSSNRIKFKRTNPKYIRNKIINKKARQERQKIQAALRQIEQDFSSERKQQMVKNEDSMKMEESFEGSLLVKKSLNTNIKIQQGQNAQIMIKTEASEEPYLFNFADAVIKQQIQQTILKIEYRQINYETMVQSRFGNNSLCKKEEW